MPFVHGDERSPHVRKIRSTRPALHQLPDGAAFPCRRSTQHLSGLAGALPRVTPLSLYVHVPFCDRLCWFCGCHTKQAPLRPDRAYLTAAAEIETVAALAAGRQGHGAASRRRLADDAQARAPDGPWHKLRERFDSPPMPRSRRDRPQRHDRGPLRRARGDRRHPRQPRRAGFRPRRCRTPSTAIQTFEQTEARGRRGCARAASARSIST